MTTRSLRWMAYAGWQVIDAVWQRVLLPLVLALLLVVAGFYSMRDHAAGQPDFYAIPSGGLRFVGQLLRQAMMTYIPLAVLMGANGIVALDRQKGFFRFFFSKPVPVPGFYVLAFIAHGVLASAGAALIAVIIGWYSTPQHVLGVAMACGLTFALLGSLLFLFSALTYQDGLVFILAWVLTLILRQVEPGMVPGHWMHTAVQVLPPTHRLDAVRDALYAGQPWQANDVWHVLAYGGACFVLTVIALRKLPLAR